MKQPVQLSHASRLLNHGPTVIVTSAHDGRRNLMSAAWSMPVEFTPPRIAIVIDKQTYSRELIVASGRFAINIPGRSLADLTYAVGSVSGREGDKFERWKIATTDGPVMGLPLMDDCVAWMECRLISEPHTQEAYDTCFAQVVSAAADDRVFANGRWSFRADNTELHTLHHLGAGNFAVSDAMITARPMA